MMTYGRLVGSWKRDESVWNPAVVKDICLVEGKFGMQWKATIVNPGGDGIAYTYFDKDFVGEYAEMAAARRSKFLEACRVPDHDPLTQDEALAKSVLVGKLILVRFSSKPEDLRQAWPRIKPYGFQSFYNTTANKVPTHGKPAAEVAVEDDF